MEEMTHLKNRTAYIYDLLKCKATELGLRYTIEIFKRDNCEYLMVYIETPKIEYCTEQKSINIEEFKTRNKVRSEFSKHILCLTKENDIPKTVKFSYPPVLPEVVGANYYK